MTVLEPTTSFLIYKLDRPCKPIIRFIIPNNEVDKGNKESIEETNDEDDNNNESHSNESEDLA